MVKGQTKSTVNRYREIQQKIEAATRKRNLEKAEDTAELARMFAPVLTGALRDSIEVESNARTGEARVVVGVPYGIVAEYGSVNRPAHPYMTPAVEAIKKQYQNKPLKIK